MIGRRFCISESRLLRVLELARKIAIKQEPDCDEAKVLKEFINRFPDEEKRELWAILAVGRGRFEEYESAKAKAGVSSPATIVRRIVEQSDLSKNLYFGIRKVIGKIAGDEEEKQALS